MSSNGEIIHLHVGQAGIQIANACWELYCLEHGVNAHGCMFDNPRDDSFRTFFACSSTPKVVPRLVMVDSEPTVIDEIRTGAYGHLFKPETLITGKEDSGSNFARGYYTLGAELIELTMNSIRCVAEACSNLKGFLEFRSIGGGTGSGLGDRLLEQITDEYGKITKVDCLIVPSPSISPLIVEPYNSVLATHFGMEFSDCTFILDNEALYDICENKLDVPNPTYTNLNRIIGQVISAMTASLRFYGSTNTSITEFQTNLVPFPRIHFPLISYAPLVTMYSSCYTELTTEQLTYECFQPGNQLIRCCPSEGKYMACVLLYRGNVAPGDINQSINIMREKGAFEFVDWSPTGFKIGINAMPPCPVPGGDVGATDRALMALSNNTIIHKVFCRMLKKYDSLFARQAFIHHFLSEGLEESIFTEASEDLCALIQDYKEVEGNSVDGSGDGGGEFGPSSPGTTSRGKSRDKSSRGKHRGSSYDEGSNIGSPRILQKIIGSTDTLRAIDENSTPPQSCTHRANDEDNKKKSKHPKKIWYCCDCHLKEKQSSPSHSSTESATLYFAQRNCCNNNKDQKQSKALCKSDDVTGRSGNKVPNKNQRNVTSLTTGKVLSELTAVNRFLDLIEKKCLITAKSVPKIAMSNETLVGNEQHLYEGDNALRVSTYRQTAKSLRKRSRSSRKSSRSRKRLRLIKQHSSKRARLMSGSLYERTFDVYHTSVKMDKTDLVIPKQFNKNTYDPQRTLNSQNINSDENELTPKLKGSYAITFAPDLVDDTKPKSEISGISTDDIAKPPPHLWQKPNIEDTHSDQSGSVSKSKSYDKMTSHTDRTLVKPSKRSSKSEFKLDIQDGYSDADKKSYHSKCSSLKPLPLQKLLSTTDNQIAGKWISPRTRSCTNDDDEDHHRSDMLYSTKMEFSGNIKKIEAHKNFLKNDPRLRMEKLNTNANHDRVIAVARSSIARCCQTELNDKSRAVSRLEASNLSKAQSEPNMEDKKSNKEVDNKKGTQGAKTTDKIASNGEHHNGMQKYSSLKNSKDTNFGSVGTGCSSGSSSFKNNGSDIESSKSSSSSTSHHSQSECNVRRIRAGPHLELVSISKSCEKNLTAISTRLHADAITRSPITFGSETMLSITNTHSDRSRTGSRSKSCERKTYADDRSSSIFLANDLIGSKTVSNSQSFRKEIDDRTAVRPLTPLQLQTRTYESCDQENLISGSKTSNKNVIAQTSDTSILHKPRIIVPNSLDPKQDRFKKSKLGETQPSAECLKSTIQESVTGPAPRKELSNSKNADEHQALTELSKKKLDVGIIHPGKCDLPNPGVGDRPSFKPTKSSIPVQIFPELRSTYSGGDALPLRTKNCHKCDTDVSAKPPQPTVICFRVELNLDHPNACGNNILLSLEKPHNSTNNEDQAVPNSCCLSTALNRNNVGSGPALTSESFTKINYNGDLKAAPLLATRFFGANAIGTQTANGTYRNKLEEFHKIELDHKNKIINDHNIISETGDKNYESAKPPRSTNLNTECIGLKEYIPKLRLEESDQRANLRSKSFLKIASKGDYSLSIPLLSSATHCHQTVHNIISSDGSKETTRSKDFDQNSDPRDQGTSTILLSSTTHGSPTHFDVQDNNSKAKWLRRKLKDSRNTIGDENHGITSSTSLWKSDSYKANKVGRSDEPHRIGNSKIIRPVPQTSRTYFKFKDPSSRDRFQSPRLEPASNLDDNLNKQVSTSKSFVLIDRNGVHTSPNTLPSFIPHNSDLGYTRTEHELHYEKKRPKIYFSRSRKRIQSERGFEEKKSEKHELYYEKQKSKSMIDRDYVSRPSKSELSKSGFEDTKSKPEFYEEKEMSKTMINIAHVSRSPKSDRSVYFDTGVLISKPGRATANDDDHEGSKPMRSETHDEKSAVTSSPRHSDINYESRKPSQSSNIYISQSKVRAWSINSNEIEVNPRSERLQESGRNDVNTSDHASRRASRSSDFFRTEMHTWNTNCSGSKVIPRSESNTPGHAYISPYNPQSSNLSSELQVSQAKVVNSKQRQAAAKLQDAKTNDLNTSDHVSQRISRLRNLTRTEVRTWNTNFNGTEVVSRSERSFNPKRNALSSTEERSHIRPPYPDSSKLSSELGLSRTEVFMWNTHRAETELVAITENSHSNPPDHNIHSCRKSSEPSIPDQQKNEQSIRDKNLTSERLQRIAYYNEHASSMSSKSSIQPQNWKNFIVRRNNMEGDYLTSASEFSKKTAYESDYYSTSSRTSMLHRNRIDIRELRRLYIRSKRIYSGSSISSGSRLHIRKIHSNNTIPSQKGFDSRSGISRASKVSRSVKQYYFGNIKARSRISDIALIRQHMTLRRKYKIMTRIPTRRQLIGNEIPPIEEFRSTWLDSNYKPVEDDSDRRSNVSKWSSGIIAKSSPRETNVFAKIPKLNLH